MKKGIPCQDKTATYSADGCHAAVLADGAGSARLSHHGAERVCSYMSRHLCREFENLYAMHDAGQATLQIAAGLTAQISMLAAELECAPADLASTLLAVAVKDGRYIIIHLGDGVIAYRKQGVLRVASLPDNGEFANTTTFTTSRSAAASMNVLKGCLGDIDGFALMSDGSSASLYDKRRKVPAAVLGKIMDYCTYYAGDTLQNWLQESLEEAVKPCTSDDCSLAFLAAEPAEYRGVPHLPRAEQCSLTGLPPHRADTGRRLRKAMAVLAALEHGPLTCKELGRCVHIRTKYLHRPLQILQQARMVKKLPCGRIAANTR